MIGHIETFEDVRQLTHVMSTVGYKVVFRSGLGYVLEDKDGNKLTDGYRKYNEFLSVCKDWYDKAKTEVE